MRRPLKIALWIFGSLLMLIALLWTLAFAAYDWKNKPYCHKQMTLALILWTNNHDTAVFPNVGGDSSKSIGAMTAELFVTNQVLRDYKYVPGLRGDDPQDLVVFYFNRPTRWRWHGPPEYRWKPKLWIVVPVDSYYWDKEGTKRVGTAPNQIIGYGEQSESLTTEQFTNRLIVTLDFLRTNNRPNWETVVKEHTAFLNSLPEKP